MKFFFAGAFFVKNRQSRQVSRRSLLSGLEPLALLLAEPLVVLSD